MARADAAADVRVTEPHKPDDAGQFDLLGVWAGSEAQRDRILVYNPTRLYGFD